MLLFLKLILILLLLETALINSLNYKDNISKLKNQLKIDTTENVEKLNSNDSDKMILLQSAWRHGDRSPIWHIKNDNESWPQGAGQLTAEGMKQHVILGLKLRQRYINEYSFVSPKYKSQEIYIRSTDVNRTLISAISNTIGFYNGSGIAGIDYPEINIWPGSFVPVGNPNRPCKRMKAILKEMFKTPEYQKIASDYQWLVDIVSANSKPIDFWNLYTVYDIFWIEKHYNRTLPAWVTPKVFAALGETYNFYFAATGGWIKMTSPNGIDIRTELRRIRGAPILWELIWLARFKLSCAQLLKDTSELCAWLNNLKYYAHSVHDVTISSLFAVLDTPKSKIDEVGYPEYSSCVTLELWQRSNGTNYIKFIYWDPKKETSRDITKFVSGCEKNGCSLEELAKRSQKYNLDEPIEKLCENTNFKNNNNTNLANKIGEFSIFIYLFIIFIIFC